MTNNVVHLKQVVESAVAGHPLYPRYKVVGLHRAFVHSWNNTLPWLLFTTDPEEYSPTYYSVRQLLMQCWADRRHQGRVAPFSRGLGDRIELQLNLDLSHLQQGAAEKMLEMISSLRGVQPSVHTELCVPGVASVKATNAILHFIQGLWKTYGIRVAGIDLGALETSAIPLVAREFFCNTLLSDVESLTPTRIELDDNARFSEFTAVCSAILNSSTIRSVSFNLPERPEGLVDDHSRYWQWIAYAIFSADATHSLDHVDLFVDNLRRKDVHSFREVLKARDPLAYVASNELVEQSSEEKAAHVPSVVDVTPRATLVVANEDAELKSESRAETLRVVQHSPDKEHVAVVYPGAGVCFVHRSEIIEHREIAQRKTVRRLKSLSLSIRDTTALSELTRMLKPIGAKIHHLTILGDNGVCLEDAIFAGIFSACPELRRLTLDLVDVTSFNWLETVGTRLTSLSLTSVDSRQRGGYKGSLVTLGSWSTAIIQVHIQATADKLEKLIDDAVRMLEANLSIERLLLSVETEAPDARVLTAIAQRLEALNGSVVDGPAGPLALKSKLALISVISAWQPRQTSREEHPEMLKRESLQLDSVVLSTIFRFAASRKQRMCGFIPTISR